MSKRRPRKPRRLRVMVLMHRDLVPPKSIEGFSEKEVAEWKTEYDVVTCLEDLGHEVRPCGVHDDLGTIRDAIDQFNPHITFNLLEEFHGIATYNYSVVSYLELLRRRYTGCNPRGLLLCRDKALSKQVLMYHRIPVPRFLVAPMGRIPRTVRRLRYPLIVKSLTEEASLGIAQASLVTCEERLRERIGFIHESVGTDAIVEEYIEGRELYVGVLGNQRVEALPVWEMYFDGLPEGAPRIATRKVKWDLEYQKRINLRTGPAAELGDDKVRRIHRLCMRAYKVLGVSGYARMDLRMGEDGSPYLIEANPNPQVAFGEDFAESAHHADITYDALLQRIINLGLAYRPLWKQVE